MLAHLKIVISLSLKKRDFPHLELVVNCNMLDLVEVGHGDLQLVGILASQAVELFKTDPSLSLKKLIRTIFEIESSAF